LSFLIFAKKKDMNQIIKNILAVLAGLIIGACVNMGVLMLFMELIPPIFELQNFIGPFLAHALGTFVGAFIVAVITKNLRLNLIIGFSFLIGGAMEVANLSAPLWFNVLDLVMAYIPMAFLGYRTAFFIDFKKK
jgi:hypothetical protein